MLIESIRARGTLCVNTRVTLLRAHRIMRIYANSRAADGDIGARCCTCNGLYVNATVHRRFAFDHSHAIRAIRCIKQGCGFVQAVYAVTIRFPKSRSPVFPFFFFPPSLRAYLSYFPVLRSLDGCAKRLRSRPPEKERGREKNHPARPFTREKRNRAMTPCFEYFIRALTTGK